MFTPEMQSYLANPKNNYTLIDNEEHPNLVVLKIANPHGYNNKKKYTCFQITELPDRYQPITVTVKNNSPHTIKLDQSDYLGLLHTSIRPRNLVAQQYTYRFKTFSERAAGFIVGTAVLGVITLLGGALAGLVISDKPGDAGSAVSAILLLMGMPAAGTAVLAQAIPRMLRKESMVINSANQAIHKSTAQVLTKNGDTRTVAPNHFVTLEPGQTFTETIFLNAPSLTVPDDILEKASLTYTTL